MVVCDSDPDVDAVVVRDTVCELDWLGVAVLVPVVLVDGVDDSDAETEAVRLSEGVNDAETVIEGVSLGVAVVLRVVDALGI